MGACLELCSQFLSAIIGLLMLFAPAPGCSPGRPRLGAGPGRQVCAAVCSSSSMTDSGDLAWVGPHTSAGCPAGPPDTPSTPNGVSLGAVAAGKLSVAWQEAQLAAARPLLAHAPEDEVVGELYAQQAALLAQLATNGARGARLLQQLLPWLPVQLRGARVRGEQARLVDLYLAAEKEAKKHDRKLKKDKEAAALLAAATAAAAASPRNSHLRREGSFVGTPGGSPGAWEAGASAAGPAGGGIAAAPQQTELARAAAAGAAAIASGKPPKAPGSGPRSGGPSKPRVRQKALEGQAVQAGRPAGRGGGQGAGELGGGERSWRGKPVRPTLSDEWPQAASGEALCAVCGQGESAAPNEIVFCEQCRVAVHQECYGVRAIPAGPWWCQPCAYQRQHRGASVPAPVTIPGEPPGRGHPGTQCALCPGRTGAMKRATAAGPDAAPRWVHVFCAQWMPGTNPGKGEGALVEGLETLGADCVNVRCSLCGSKLGACLTVSHGAGDTGSAPLKMVHLRESPALPTAVLCSAEPCWPAAACSGSICLTLPSPLCSALRRAAPTSSTPPAHATPAWL